MNNTYLGNLLGYAGGVIVWVFDHWSGLAAFLLFVLQAVYQAYRIKKVKRECADQACKED